MVEEKHFYIHSAWYRVQWNPFTFISITQAVAHNLTAFLDFSLAVHWQDRLSTLSNSVINTIQSLNPVAASRNQHCERVR